MFRDGGVLRTLLVMHLTAGVVQDVAPRQRVPWQAASTKHLA